MRSRYRFSNVINSLVSIALIIGMQLGLSNRVFALDTLSEAIVNPANQHSYYLLAESSWQEAETEAVALGGHLVTINDAAEQDWVFSTFGNYAGSSKSLWIGLRVVDDAGKFEWVSGETVDFTHWYTGQPDNIFKEDYVHLIRTGGNQDTASAGFWNDSKGPNSYLGYDPYHGVVEIAKNGPKAVFSATPQSETIPTTVNLDASSSSNDTGKNLRYSWKSSDGQVTEGIVAQLIFSQAGIFTITLTITDDQGAVSNSQKIIRVQAQAFSNTLSEPIMASSSFIELNDTPELALPILVNDTPIQQIFYKNVDEDWYVFYAHHGKKYTVEIPGDAVGSLINPSLQLFDNQQQPLTLVYTQSFQDSGVRVTGMAPYTGFYYIRIVNQPPFAKGNDVMDHLYQLRVYLTDEPQQGIIRGNVLSSCNNTGIYQAEVAAFLNGGVTDSTLTHKTGEFGLPLNPNSYLLKSFATNFIDAELNASVTPNEISWIQLNQSPKTDCNTPSQNVDLALLEQQAVAVYDSVSGTLVVRDVWVGNTDNVYYAELHNNGHFQFQLGRVIRIPGTIHVEPANYSVETSLFNFPTIYAYNKLWKVQMKNQGNWLFTLEVVE